jgi:hypothetical protein
MSNVHANVEDLRRLSRDIDATVREVGNAVKRLNGSLRRADWNDASRRAFEAEVKDLTATIARFTQRAEALKPVLDRKVRELEAYLR